MVDRVRLKLYASFAMQHKMMMMMQNADSIRHMKQPKTDSRERTPPAPILCLWYCMVHLKREEWIIYHHLVFHNCFTPVPWKDMNILHLGNSPNATTKFETHRFCKGKTWMSHYYSFDNTKRCSLHYTRFASLSAFDWRTYLHHKIKTPQLTCATCW